MVDRLANIFMILDIAERKEQLEKEGIVFKKDPQDPNEPDSA
jgi:hypothetical protein